MLLADEPTGNLDSERSVEIMELLAELNAEAGLTVLLVTHEPEMAAYARKIVHFKDGLVDNVEIRSRSDQRGSSHMGPGQTGFLKPDAQGRPPAHSLIRR